MHKSDKTYSGLSGSLFLYQRLHHLCWSRSSSLFLLLDNIKVQIHHMAKPCDLCGSADNQEVLSTCSDCSTARHAYCKLKIGWDVPKEWICEECELRKNKVSPKHSEKDQLPIAVTSTLGIVDNDTTFRGDTVRKVCSKRQKMARSGKVKFMPTEEVLKLTSGATKVDIPLRGALEKFSNKSNSMASMSKKTPAGSNTCSPKFVPFKLKASSSFRPARPLTPPKHFSVSHMTQASTKLKAKTLEVPAKKTLCRDQPNIALKVVNECETSNLMVEKVTDKASCVSSSSKSHRPIAISEAKTLAAPARKTLCRDQPNISLKVDNECGTSNIKVVKKVTDKGSCVSSPLKSYRPIIISGGNVCADSKLKKPIVEETNPLNVQRTIGNYIPNLPRMDATWKGSFEIVGTGTAGKVYKGFQAHPPSRINRKAYEFSKQMPVVLQFKLLPRFNLWTEIFQDDTPDGDDIALYITPGAFERSELHYECVLEGMEMHDSVMSSHMNGVELLIFSSKLLHMDFQSKLSELYKKSLLCGVFRRIKESKAIIEAPPLPVEQEEVPMLTYHSDDNGYENTCDKDMDMDMEIDMLGGENIGKIDVVVSKGSTSQQTKHLTGFHS